MNSTTRIVANLAPKIITKQIVVNISNGNVYRYDYNAIDPDVNDNIDTLTWYANTSLFDINTSTGEISDTPTESEAGVYYILAM